MEEDIKQYESELLNTGYLFVRCSELGGEVICMAADNARLPEGGNHEGKIIYRMSELRHIVRSKPSAETLRAIHEVKRITGGRYEGSVSADRQAESYVIDERKERRRREAEKRKGNTRRKTETPTDSRPEFK